MKKSKKDEGKTDLINWFSPHLKANVNRIIEARNDNISPAMTALAFQENDIDISTNDVIAVHHLVDSNFVTKSLPKSEIEKITDAKSPGGSLDFVPA